MSNSEGVIFLDLSEDEVISAVAREQADDLIPILSHADFQSQVMKIIIGIFAAHFQNIRQNVASALHAKDLEAERLLSEIETLKDKVVQLQESNRTLRLRMRWPENSNGQVEE
jgi:hypothetical protein